MLLREGEDEEDKLLEEDVWQEEGSVKPSDVRVEEDNEGGKDVNAEIRMVSYNKISFNSNYLYDECINIKSIYGIL